MSFNMSLVSLFDDPYVCMEISEYLRDDDHINTCIAFGINVQSKCLTWDYMRTHFVKLQQRYGMDWLIKASEHLGNSDHINMCITLGIYAHPKCLTWDYMCNNFGELEQRYGMGWLIEALRSFRKRVSLEIHWQWGFYGVDVARLTTVITRTIHDPEKLIQLRKFIFWPKADYNRMPESIYNRLWPYFHKPSFYKRCNKVQWLYDHAKSFDKRYLRHLLSNDNVLYSPQMLVRYSPFVDWTKCDYSLLPAEMLKHCKSSIDSRQFSATIKNRYLILEFAELIDWNVMRDGSSDLESLHNFGAIDEPYPNIAINKIMAFCPTHNTYDVVEAVFYKMPKEEQMYFTRYPSRWYHYILTKKVCWGHWEPRKLQGPYSRIIEA